MTRGQSRWDSKDLRHFFPLPSERKDAPRFDGEYVATDAPESIQFRTDGTLTWDGRDGTWQMHGTTLHLAVAAQEGEGAFGSNAVYLLSAIGTGRDDRRQSVLTFKPYS